MHGNIKFKTRNKEFGPKGYEATHGKMIYIHKRTCFKPIKVAYFNPIEIKGALEPLLFLVKKKDERIKARTCANGSAQKEWMQKEETSSPTAYLESVMLTSVIDYKEDRYIVTVYIPNLFIQTPIDSKPGEDKIMIEIKGVLVDMLAQMDPEKYFPNVVYKKVNKVLYLDFLKAIYGATIRSIIIY